MTDTSTASTLDTVAGLMDADTICGRQMGIGDLDDLIYKAVFGRWAGPAHGPEWARICHSEGLEAAQAWSDGMHDRYLALCHSLFPKGQHSPSLTSAEVRALADSHRTTA